VNDIFLGLGSNLGNRHFYLEKALKILSDSGCTILKCSSVYWSAPWGNPELRPFLNLVCKVHFEGSPEEFLDCCQETEKKMGRKTRKGGYKNRIIDIDLLFFHQKRIHTDSLIVPHPEIANRKFILRAMVEIDENFVHPITNKSMKELLLETTDPLEVKLWGRINI